jgi:hypothetical protein
MRGTFSISSFLPTNNSPKNLPAYFSWLDAVSYVKYAYIGAALNENAGLVLRCTPKELKFNAQGQSICPVTSGAQVMADLGMSCVYLQYPLNDCLQHNVLVCAATFAAVMYVHSVALHALSVFIANVFCAMLCDMLCCNS